MARAKPLQHVRQACVRQGEAALAPAEHAMRPRHLGTYVPGSMNNNGARKGVVVGRIESRQADRSAVRTDIEAVGPVRTGGRRMRLRFVGKALQPARVRGI